MLITLLLAPHPDIPTLLAPRYLLKFAEGRVGLSPNRLYCSPAFGQFFLTIPERKRDTAQKLLCHLTKGRNSPFGWMDELWRTWLPDGKI